MTAREDQPQLGTCPTCGNSERADVICQHCGRVRIDGICCNGNEGRGVLADSEQGQSGSAADVRQKPPRTLPSPPLSNERPSELSAVATEDQPRPTHAAWCVYANLYGGKCNCGADPGARRAEAQGEAPQDWKWLYENERAKMPQIIEMLQENTKVMLKQSKLIDELTRELVETGAHPSQDARTEFEKSARQGCDKLDKLKLGIGSDIYVLLMDAFDRGARSTYDLEVDAILRVAVGELDRGTPEQRLEYIAATCRIILRRDPLPGVPGGSTPSPNDKVLEGLRYIADSPAHEHGGFHPEAVKTAKNAISEIERLREALRQRGEERDEWKRQSLTLVVLLKAECSDEEWATMNTKFDAALAPSLPLGQKEGL